MTIELETPLYRELAAFQRGDRQAAGRAYDLLINHPSHSLARLMPALKVMLTLDNEDLQVIAAVKLGGLGEDASPLLNDLKELALKQIRPQSFAAATSLGCIPGAPSLEGLIEIGECWAKTPEMREGILYHLLPSFVQHGEAMRPFLKRFEAAIGPCFSADDQGSAIIARNEMKKAYYRLGLFNSWENAQAKLPASPALERRGELLDPTPERLPATEGLVAKRTMTANLGGDAMLFGVEVYNPTTGERLDKPVVALSFLRMPSNWTFEETFTMLASLIRAKFDLPADDAVWLDYNPPHSDRNPYPHPTTFQVDMVFFDECGRYGVPNFSLVRSISAVVKEARG
jgi:hypothetical protein